MFAGGGYTDSPHGVSDISEWIPGYYNTIHPHRHNSGLSPCQYEDQWEEAMQVS